MIAGARFGLWMLSSFFLSGYLMLIFAFFLMTLLILSQGLGMDDMLFARFWMVIVWLDPFMSIEEMYNWSGDPMPIMFRALLVVSCVVGAIEWLLRRGGLVSDTTMTLKQKIIVSFAFSFLCSTILVGALLHLGETHFEGGKTGWVFTLSLVPSGLMLVIGTPCLWVHHHCRRVLKK